MGTPPIPHRTSRAEIASGLEIITGNVSVSVITSRWSSLEVSHSETSPPNALATALATSGSPVVKRHVDRLAGRPLTIFPERTRPTTSSENTIRFLGAALGSVSKMRTFILAPYLFEVVFGFFFVFPNAEQLGDQLVHGCHPVEHHFAR